MELMQLFFSFLQIGAFSFVTGLAFLYTRYRNLSVLQGILKTLRPAVVSMIFVAGLNIFLPSVFLSGRISFSDGNFQLQPFLLFLAAMLLLRVKKMDPIKVMTGCGIAELIFRLVFCR